MGVYDYSCFFHGEEGKQCLSLHYECYYSDIVDENDPDIWREQLDHTDDLLSVEIIETHETSVSGAGEAYLLLFKIPNSKDLKNTEFILHLIREKKIINRVLVKDSYDWSIWSFNVYRGYRYYLQQEKGMTGKTAFSIWKPKRIDPDGETWAINICPPCASLFFPELNIAKPQKICSEYLRSIAEKHEIPVKTNSKTELIAAIQEHFKFLL
jgi:hypothetical protein